MSFEGDHRCGKLPPAMADELWNAKHLPHLTEGATFREEVMAPAPSYDVAALICPCGARYYFCRPREGGE